MKCKKYFFLHLQFITQNIITVNIFWYSQNNISLKEICTLLHFNIFISTIWLINILLYFMFLVVLVYNFHVSQSTPNNTRPYHVYFSHPVLFILVIHFFTCYKILLSSFKIINCQIKNEKNVHNMCPHSFSVFHSIKSIQISTWYNFFNLKLKAVQIYH